MKKSLGIFLLAILASVVLPFGPAHKAFAVEAETVLDAPSSNFDFCGVGQTCTIANGLKITQVGGTNTGSGPQTSAYSDAITVQLELSFHSDGSNYAAHDQPDGQTGHGQVDWNDISNSFWGALYNIENFASIKAGGGDINNGLFVRVGTEKDTVNDGNNNYQFVVKNGSDVNFDVRRPLLGPNEPNSSYGLPKKTSSPGSGYGRELLKVLIEDPTKFFGQDNNGQKTFNPVITLTGLQANTLYRIQLIAEEAGGSNDYFWSNLLEVRTKVEDSTSKFGATPVSAEVVAAVTDAPPPSEDGNDALSEKLDCMGVTYLHLSGCIAELFNSALVPISVYIANAAGSLFDAFAAVSLGSTIYGQGTAGANIASFVENGWSVVRDISNIFFIFILLYAALGLVLSLHHFDTKKIVAQTIVIALLINFSLFFCRVTIDASNILSRVFYNAMSTSYQIDKPITNESVGVKEQAISGAIVQGIQPQKVLSGEMIKRLNLTVGSILLILIIAFILNLVLAWIFFMCAAFFAGRIGVIWFSMIFAPLAFVTSIVPGLDKSLKQLGWHSWLSTFLSACFKAPVFFFFLYLIVNLVGGSDGGLLGTTIAAVSNAQNGSWVSFLVAILLPTMIIVGLLMAAKKIAEEMAGEFGGVFAGIVAAGTGLAAMAVTGGAAIAGRTVVGSAAARLANPESKAGNALRNMAAGKVTTGFGSTGIGKWMARQGVNAVDTGKKASFDIRNTGLANSVSKATGVDMNVGSKIPLMGGALKSFSTENTAGGFEGKAARQAEKDRIFADKLGFDKTEHDKVGETIEKREEDISKQEDVVERLQGEVAAAKARNDQPAQKAAQDSLNAAKEDLRIMKKGGDKNNPAHVWTDADTRNPNAVKADGTRVTDKDVGQLKTEFIGLEKLKKAQENIKTSRAKEYYNDRIVKSGAHIHNPEKRDALGNITKFAHADMSNDWRQIGKNLTRDFISGFAPGALVGSVVGPLGSVGTGIAFGLAKVVRAGIEDGLGQMRHEAAHLASDSSHKIHKGTSSYKSPTSGFTDMFKGLGGGGGGGGHDHGHGGGHDDHGHGGDDHGGHH